MAVLDAAGFDDVLGAVDRVLQRVEDQGLDPRWWSVAELALDASDLAWLDRWRADWLAAELEGKGQGVSLLLLVAVAELARRIAREHVLWPEVESSLNDAARRRLFQNGQPSSLFRELMETGFRQYGLRHALDSPAAEHRWYRSVTLQFGFTLRGARESLGRWLAGYGCPDAAEHLLDASGGAQGFREFWQNLRLLRQDTELDPVSALAGNAWAIPGEEQTLASAARRERELGLGSSVPGGTFETLLRWEATGPSFFLRLQEPLEVPFDSSSFTLSSAGKELTQLLRRSDGSYRWRHELRKLPTLPIAELELRTRDGRLVDVVPLPLWDSHEPTLFTKRGEDFLAEPSAWAATLRAGEEVTLVVPRCPPRDVPGEAQRGGLSGDAVAVRLRIRADTAIRFGEGDEWSPSLQAAAVRIPATLVHAEGGIVRPFTWGERVKLRLPRPHDFEPERLLIFGSQYGLSNSGQEFESDEFELTPGVSSDLLQARVQGKDRRGVRSTRATFAPLRMRSALLCSKGKRRALDGKDEVRANELRFARVVVWLSDGATPSLFEGRRNCGEVGSQGKVLARPQALGAPLWVRSESDKLKLASAVVDTGYVESASVQQTCVTLSFTQAMEPSGATQVFLWAPDGWKLRPPTPTSDRTWQVDAEASEPGVVAVCQAGVRLGTYWLRRPSDFLKSRSELSLEELALLRWLSAPVLEPGLFRILAQRLRRPRRLPPKDTVLDFVLAWGLGRGLPARLSHYRRAEDQEHWRAALRELLWGRWPKGDAHDAFLYHLQCAFPEREEGPWSYVMEELGALDPILAVRALWMSLRDRAGRTKWEDLEADKARIRKRFFPDQQFQEVFDKERSRYAQLLAAAKHAARLEQTNSVDLLEHLTSDATRRMVAAYLLLDKVPRGPDVEWL